MSTARSSTAKPDHDCRQLSPPQVLSSPPKQLNRVLLFLTPNPLLLQSPSSHLHNHAHPNQSSTTINRIIFRLREGSLKTTYLQPWTVFPTVDLAPYQSSLTKFKEIVWQKQVLPATITSTICPTRHPQVVKTSTNEYSSEQQLQR